MSETGPRRGEVWLADLDPAPPARGHEQAGRRPVLVVSDDRYNAGPAGLTIVIPLTKRLRPIPLHVLLHAPEGGLRVDSSIQCDQVRAISRGRLVQRWGAITSTTMTQVEIRLRTVLGV